MPEAEEGVDARAKETAFVNDFSSDEIGLRSLRITSN
jgi:hypothetical protein